MIPDEDYNLDDTTDVVATPDDTDTEQQPQPNTSKLADKIRSSPEIIQDMRNLSNDPKYQTQVPAGARQSLKEAMDKAQDLYTQKTNRNDWLEVAQLVGNSLAQIGAARANSNSIAPGANSPINVGPGINYQARNERAGQEYNRSVAGSEALNTAGRQEYEDQFRNNAEEYKKQEAPLSAELGEAKVGEQAEKAYTLAEMSADKANKLQELKNIERDRTLSSQEQREKASLENQLKIAEMRENNRADREDRRTDRSSLQSTLKDNNAELNRLQQEEKNITQQLNTGVGVVNDLVSSPDINRKDADKVKAKLGDRAGKAGLDLGAGVDYLNSPDVPKRKSSGIIGGTLGFKEVDPAAARPVLEQKMGLSNLRQSLDEIKRRKQQLQQDNQKLLGTPSKASFSTSTTQPVAQAQQPTSQSNKVMVVSPNGQKGLIPKEQVQDALGQGYTLSK